MATLNLVLPWPITVNHYYADRVIVPRTKGARAFVQKYISERGRKYREDVVVSCMMPAIKQWSKDNHGKPLALHVDCYPPDKRERDLGNLDKVLLDSLQHAGVIRNDYDVWDQRFTRMCLSAPPGRVVVRLSPFDLGSIGQ